MLAKGQDDSWVFCLDTCTKKTGNVPIDKITVDKGTKLRLFSHFCMGKQNSNVERNDIWIYMMVILFICGQDFYFGQASFCPGFLLSVGLWGENPIMGHGETDFKETCGMHWVPVWKPGPDTNNYLSLLDACWVKWTQREDEDGCLKSKSLQWRRSLLSVILSIPPGALLLKAFFWRFCWGTGKPLLMEASAEVSGNLGKLLPKAGQASYDDVVVTSLWLYRARSLLGKEVDVPHGEHPKEGTSQGRKVVTHHILTTSKEQHC